MKKVLKFLAVLVLGMVIGTAMASGGTESSLEDVERLSEENQELRNELEIAQNLAQEEAAAPAEEEAAPEEVVAEEPAEEVVAPEVATLGTGTFIVGQDIQAGRYVVSTEESMGNFFVHGDGLFSGVNEILGTDPDMAVNNITVTLEEGQEIEISGLNAVVFTPKQ